MPKFFVTGTVTITVNCVVEAKDEETARELAESADMMRLCHYCAGGIGKTAEVMDEWRTSGELDGTPEILEVEKV